jgi:RNA polymerase sigma-70 factor (ECF subfamily)
LAVQKSPTVPRETREGVLRLLPVPDQDSALVAALRARHPGAPGVLVDRYGSYVERLLVRVVGLRVEVRDLVHEVFKRALEGIHELRQPEALKGWLGSLTVFTARSWIRAQRFRRTWLSFLPPTQLPETAAPETEPEVNDALRRTYEVLDRLPTDARIVFALRYMNGMGLRETAEHCNVSLSTVKRRLDRAEELFLRDARRDPVLREQIERGDRWRSR